MTGITTAKTSTLIIALALSLAATSAFAEATRPTMTRHATSAMANVKTLAKKPASALEAARGVSSRASVDQRPDVPGYPPAQAAQ